MTESKQQKPGGIFLPHLLWKDLMPQLRDTEFRLALVIAGHTLAWKERSGVRRRRHWLSHAYLKQLTGRSGQSVSDAIDALVSRGLIGVWTEGGLPLSTKHSRQAHRGKLLYGFCDDVVASILDCNGWLEAPKFFHTATPKLRLQKAETKYINKLSNNNANNNSTRIYEGWVRAGAVGVFRPNSSNELPAAATAEEEGK